MTDLARLTPPELFRLYSDVLDELRHREIIRSSNNPVADYSEFLFCRAFDWNREKNSKAGYDARKGNDRYQIKGRRPRRHNKSRQLSAIRKLDSDPFDFLAGVIFTEVFAVHRAAIVPIAIVREHARRVRPRQCLALQPRRRRLATRRRSRRDSRAAKGCVSMTTSGDGPMRRRGAD